jgi:outer membrane protein, heavy metal efflux system
MLSRALLTGMLLALGLAAAGPVGAAAQTPALDSLLAAPMLDAPFFERVVLERNPSLGAMRASWRAAEAEADRAGAWDDPMVEIMTAPGSWSSTTVDPGYMASISQHIPIFGQRGLEGRASRAGARAMGEDFRTARLDMLREARRAYYEYYLVARRQGINADLKDLMTQFRRTAVGKYSAGTVGLSDALQADVELAMLDHEEVALARDRRVVTARMNALLQRESGPFPDPPADITLPAAPMRADSIHALALALRPELRSWSEQGHAKEAELSLARRNRLPDFTLTGRYDRFMAERGWRPQVGIGLNLPIQFGRLGAAEREARAGVEQMEFRRQAAEAEIGSEVESALARVQETEHEIHIIRERVVPATERALQAIRASYENNRADFLSLLNAERDLARARLDLYRAEATYLQNVADLDRAVGVDPEEVRR